MAVTDEKKNVKIIEPIAENTLSIFSDISSAAASGLGQPQASGPGSFASINTFTSREAVKSLESINDAHQNALQVLSREPAIARIVAEREDGKKVIYFICRATPVDISNDKVVLASYLAPIGRLASLPTGSEFKLEKPKGTEYLKVLERAELHPSMLEGEWDSENSILQGEKYGPLTVVSFRGLLEESDDDTLLAKLLDEEEASSKIIEGVRRSVITRMGLRDQPILDQYQDEIFRMPLGDQLLILGPPGSGKTTTLIRRLGQKLDKAFLEEDENEIVERAKLSSAPDHESSWVMFTPTELLKQYLKEAFAREGIPASDQRISTWSDYRRELARNQFNILRRTAAGGGAFILKEALKSLQESTLSRQTEWFEDFQVWQTKIFWEEIDEAALELSDSNEALISELGLELSKIVKNTSITLNASIFLSIDAVREKVQELISGKKTATDGQIRSALNLQVNQDNAFLDDLAQFIDVLSDEDEEPDEQDLEDEDNTQRPRTRRAAALIAYSNTIRAQARAQATKRALGRTTRSGRISEWIGDRSLNAEELRTIGESLQVQSSARKFLNPIRRYLRGIPSRYRRYRRIRQSEGKWYSPDGFAPNEIASLEIDVILLSILRSAAEFFQDHKILQNIDDSRNSSLAGILNLSRNQVLVDEATDFSPLQIACMGTISNPQIQSFFACGDFNQRITDWGSRSASEMKWALPEIDIKSIVFTYRHSKQLCELAKEIVHLCGGEASEVVLPEHIENEGVQPVLAKNLSNHDSVVGWLAQRIVEIERFVELSPSVAVLVNAEEEVGPIAGGLNEALAEQNIRVVACHNGLSLGQESDIRVFNVQHIKGLEFEAVFFIGIDQLAEITSTLFDKFLYVGITRAATYLGLTCAGAHLPQKIAAIEPHFISDWGN